MQRHAQSTLPGSRFWRRNDPDLRQALARMVIVAGALWFAFSGFYIRHAPDATSVLVGRWAALIASTIALLLLVSIVRRPGKSVVRRAIGITHDILAISIAMFLGGAATAFFAVIYVVVILASGVRFGSGYLGYAALCSLACFALVHAFNPYWEQNVALSINTVLVLTVVPAYMYRLIKARQQARLDLERRATHDSLTGLMNRAGFEQQLEELIVPGAADQVLIFIDLDRFKAVNDAAGHAAGDRLLVDVSHIVRESVRAEDICGRMGGDEICVFLRDCPMTLGMQIATRIKDRIQDHRITWSGAEYGVGASIGIVSSRSIDDGPSLLRLADAACYAAKNAGRNYIHAVDTARTRMDTGQLRALRPEEEGAIHRPKS
jgi:diguanylate cyclase (GGDEF)-like protein